MYWRCNVVLWLARNSSWAIAQFNAKQVNLSVKSIFNSGEHSDRFNFLDVR